MAASCPSLLKDMTGHFSQLSSEDGEEERKIEAFVSLSLSLQLQQWPGWVWNCSSQTHTRVCTHAHPRPTILTRSSGKEVDSHSESYALGTEIHPPPLERAPSREGHRDSEGGTDGTC